jgi:hypothetical protein
MLVGGQNFVSVRHAGSIDQEKIFIAEDSFSTSRENRDSDDENLLADRQMLLIVEQNTSKRAGLLVSGAQGARAIEGRNGMENGLWPGVDLTLLDLSSSGGRAARYCKLALESGLTTSAARSSVSVSSPGSRSRSTSAAP